MKTNDPPAGADALSGISAEAQTILPTGREGSNVLDMQTCLAQSPEWKETILYNEDFQSLFASENISSLCILYAF